MGSISMGGGDYLALRYLTSEFLDVRGMRVPNGQPLYGYRCTDAEFERMQAILRRSAPDTPTHQRGLSAIFCMFAAEWWRRNYEGGPWKGSHPRRCQPNGGKSS
jgi:hypothetical protein